MEYEARDITQDESAQGELMDMGLTAVPVTVVGDGAPIVGFDPKKIESALG